MANTGSSIVTHAIVWSIRAALFALLAYEMSQLIMFYAEKPTLTVMTSEAVNTSKINPIFCVSNARDKRQMTEKEITMYRIVKAYISRFHKDYTPNKLAAMIQTNDPETFALLANRYSNDAEKNKKVVEQWFLHTYNISDLRSGRDVILDDLFNNSVFSYRNSPYEPFKAPWKLQMSHYHTGSLCGHMTAEVKDEVPKSLLNPEPRSFKTNGFVLHISHLAKEVAAVPRDGNKAILYFLRGRGGLLTSSRIEIPSIKGLPSSYEHLINANLRFRERNQLKDCVDVEGQDEFMLAGDTLQTFCAMNCDQMAYAKVLNCSYFGFLFPEFDSTTGQLDYCYGKGLAEYQRNQIASLADRCIAAEKCAQQKPCRSYYYDYSMTRDLYQVDFVGTARVAKGEIVKKIVIALDSASLVIETEKWAMNSFLLFSNCGGLMGIFVGLSFWEIVNAAVAGLKRCFNKGEDKMMQNPTR